MNKEKSIKAAVYSLTVKEAKEIASKHEHDETWDIWTCKNLKQEVNNYEKA